MPGQHHWPGFWSSMFYKCYRQKKPLPGSLSPQSFELSAFELHFFCCSFNSSHFSFLQGKVPGHVRRAEMTTQGNLNRPGTTEGVSLVTSCSLEVKLGAELCRERPWVIRAGWEVEALGDTAPKSLLGFSWELLREEDGEEDVMSHPHPASLSAHPCPLQGCARVLVEIRRTVKTSLLEWLGVLLPRRPCPSCEEPHSPWHTPVSTFPWLATFFGGVNRCFLLTCRYPGDQRRPRTFQQVCCREGCHH